MSHPKSKRLISLLLSTFAITCFASPKTTTYTYDALGRLTFVGDSVNGNRDYDYDKAGNRLLVSTGTATDASADPLPPATVTGLKFSQIANCAYKAEWNPVSGAIYYNLGQTSKGVIKTTETTQYVSCDYNNPNSNKPYYVEACNDLGCSQRAYF